jgi:Ca-activated chloride channel family protein
MHLTAHLDVDVVALEAEDEITVLLELVAPMPTVDQERQPAALQVVLDRSGSMAADGRLEAAKSALLGLVDRLDPTDCFGLVTFDDQVRIAVAAGPLSDKAMVKARIAGLEPGGMTDLSGGYLRGLQEARRVAGPSGATVLLLSDGHANAGVTEPEALQSIASQAQGHGVVTTTLGLGLGYDEVLLGAIADAGTGEALFAEEADTAGQLIAEQVDGLLSKSVQATSLQIAMAEPVQSVFLLGELPWTQILDGAVMVELGDFWAGETRKVLMRFAVPAMASLGLAQVAELTLQYVELPRLDSHTITLPIAVNVVPGDEASGRVPNPVVRTEVAFQQAQQAKREAAEALRYGDALGASQLLNAAGQQLEEAIQAAPLEIRDALTGEADELLDMAQRAQWDDTNRMAKESFTSWHAGTRRQGRSGKRQRPDA